MLGIETLLQYGEGAVVVIMFFTIMVVGWHQRKCDVRQERTWAEFAKVHSEIAALQADVAKIKGKLDIE